MNVQRDIYGKLHPAEFVITTSPRMFRKLHKIAVDLKLHIDTEIFRDLFDCSTYPTFDFMGQRMRTVR